MTNRRSCSSARMTSANTCVPVEFHRGFFRLAVGLEDTDDLIRDIDHALVEAGFEV